MPTRTGPDGAYRIAALPVGKYRVRLDAPRFLALAEARLVEIAEGGTADRLEILLFVVGLLCIGLELFVFPGFGVFGMSGVLLVLASVVDKSLNDVLRG